MLHHPGCRTEKHRANKEHLMAKLYYYYGPMGSMKTAKAIITAYNYEEQGIETLCFTSQIDKRYGEGRLASRVQGLERPAIAINNASNVLQHFLDELEKHPVGVVICDEIQFFTPSQIDDLATIVDFHARDVLCYGLRTDFRLDLFPGSARLLALADVIREEIAMCRCGRKATVNARLIEGRVTREGAQILVGANESYRPFCRRCFRAALAKEETNSPPDGPSLP